jgi:hypothetical protein
MLPESRGVSMVMCGVAAITWSRLWAAGSADGAFGAPGPVTGPEAGAGR